MPSKLAENPGADIAVGGLIYRPENAKAFARHQRPEHVQSSRRLLCRRVYRLAFEENMGNELAGHQCELGGPFLGTCSAPSRASAIHLGCRVRSCMNADVFVDTNILLYSVRWSAK